MKFNKISFNDEWVASFKSAEEFANDKHIKHLKISKEQLKIAYRIIKDNESKRISAENKKT